MNMRIMIVAIIWAAAFFMNQANPAFAQDAEQTGELEAAPEPTVESVEAQLPSMARCLLNTQNEFLLGPGDMLEVSVWRDEELTKEVLIRPDGKFSFPLIGDVQAAGRTVDSLRVEIEERISEYVPDTPVSVLLRSLTSTRVYVVGKVANPGVFLLSEPMRVMQILSMAGGLTTFASEGGIRILRSSGGDQQVIRFDYDDAADGDDLEQNIILEPGDTIVVP